MALTPAEAELVRANFPLARHAASRYISRSPRHRADIESAANWGLCLAAHGWRADAGVKFSTYAYTAMIHEIQHALRDAIRPKGFRQSKDEGRKRARVATPSVTRLPDPEDFDVIDHRASPVDRVEAEENRERVRLQLSRLEGRAEAVIRLRFGLDDGEPRTLAKVGRELGLTRERVRQLQDQALSAMAAG